jgi:hypothetical protein
MLDLLTLGEQLMHQTSSSNVDDVLQKTPYCNIGGGYSPVRSSDAAAPVRARSSTVARAASLFESVPIRASSIGQQLTTIDEQQQTMRRASIESNQSLFSTASSDLMVSCSLLFILNNTCSIAKHKLICDRGSITKVLVMAEAT